MKKNILTFAFALILMPCFAFAKLSARFEKNTIAPNEKALLIITSDEKTSAEPDLSVLQNLFNVLSSSVSQQTYILNGQARYELSWRFSLMPLKKGKINIEPISVGNQKTNPLEILVSNTAGTNVSADEISQTPEPLYRIETQITSPKNKTPFIQQQINYTVRLIDDGALQIKSVGFETSEDFIVQELQKPKLTILSNGKRELTFSYALFALKSGKLKLPKAYIQGFSVQKPEVDGFFSHFAFVFPSAGGIQTPVTLASEEQTINVLPAPKDHGAQWWLPAKDVSINAHFINKPQTVRVGSVFKREIIIKAVGLTGEQLPEIETFSAETFKQYPEKPRTETLVSGSDIVGTIYLADVYIPQKVGVFTLPEVKINWYDTQEKQIKTAVLKAEKIHVFQNENLKETKEKTLVSDQSAQSAQTPAPTQNTLSKIPLPNEYLLFAFAFIGGILVCYIVIKPKKEKKSQPKKEKDFKEKDIFSNLQKNDLKALRDKLILWAQTNNKDKQITNLKDVADLLNDKDFTFAAEALLNALYADAPNTTFNIRAFQKIFKKAVKNKNKLAKQNKTPIPPLYS